jgi:tRNA (adenine22-N1)-methyltransferase
MKIPISDRLLCCASMVRTGSRVADIGCDHGYLGIHLLLEGIADYVAASDLRPQPLEKAKINAAQYATADRMEFSVADGLAAIDPAKVDTIVCAGMGGDSIAAILEAAPWVRDPAYTLILQPQTSGNDLRRWLGDNGFAIEEEKLVRDSGFLYFTIRAKYGRGVPLSPGEQYLSKALLSCGSELLPEYFDRILTALEKTVAGISRSRKEADRERIRYYQDALSQVREMRESYDRT